MMNKHARFKLTFSQRLWSDCNIFLSTLIFYYRCDNDINECVTLSPCKHDGVCVNVPGSFSCECPDQFTGDLCEKFRLITCENNPCMRGATCVDSPNPKTGNNFTCNCRPGYDDPICNTPYCTLPGQRCQNGRCEFSEVNYEYVMKTSISKILEFEITTVKFATAFYRYRIFRFLYFSFFFQNLRKFSLVWWNICCQI